MKLISYVLIFSVLLSVGVGAFSMSNPSYKISGVITGGGGRESAFTEPLKNVSSDYELYVSVGQPFTTGATKTQEYSPDNRPSGMLVGSNYKLCLGIFCTDVFETVYSLHVNGSISYDYGDPVANSDASLIVRYGGAKYENKITTGPNGEFNAVVMIPEFIADQRINPDGFKIQVYAKDRVEAMYTCNYKSGVCSE